MGQTITETIGLDLGDRYTRYAVLDHGSGEEVVSSGRVPSTVAGVQKFLANYPQARVVLEVGTYSRWVSQSAEVACEEVLVANPRKLTFIYQNNRKSDEADAMALARVGRMDPNLLSPITHRGEEAQRDLIIIRARAGMVSARTKLVNTLRGLVKPTGFSLPSLAADRIGTRRGSSFPKIFATSFILYCWRSKVSRMRSRSTTRGSTSSPTRSTPSQRY